MAFAAAPKLTRAGYLHPLIDGCPYEPTYQRKVRVIKGWRAEGATRSPPDLPPLDDPVAMVDWWQRVKVQTVPTDLLTARADEQTRRAAQNHAAGPTPASVAPGAPPAPGATPSPPPPAEPRRATVVNFDATAPMDIADAITFLQKTLGGLTADYRAALIDINASESTLTLRAGRVDKCLERLHQLEKTHTASQIANGDLIPRHAIRDELAPILETLAGSLRDELAAAFGLPRARLLTFTDHWFRHLRESDLTAAALPPLVPTESAA